MLSGRQLADRRAAFYRPSGRALRIAGRAAIYFPQPFRRRRRRRAVRPAFRRRTHYPRAGSARSAGCRENIRRRNLRADQRRRDHLHTRSYPWPLGVVVATALSFYRRSFRLAAEPAALRLVSPGVLVFVGRADSLGAETTSVYPGAVGIAGAWPLGSGT